ncbi:hypothetical protein RRG08_014609 [Elysia crispata]|uniref:Uncharacterized protein n=1 Tax=Elysia crispata TaxID=231223 RepID=A0AAE0YRS4_9GAST|nr:hypothetical protein RRG08_014609 [Elysia crispata]
MHDAFRCNLLGSAEEATCNKARGRGGNLKQPEMCLRKQRRRVTLASYGLKRRCISPLLP